MIPEITKSASKLLKTAKSAKPILEIERKFPKFTPLFSNNAGHPAFTSLERLPDHRFTDLYLDDHGHLMNRGIYVRLRDGEYEAKIAFSANHDGPTANQYNMAKTTTMKEIKGKQAVQEYISEHVKIESGFWRKKCRSVTIEELEKVAGFVTEREAWLADNEFLVVMDQTCFGHKVGEVEYAGEVELKSDGDKEEQVKVAEEKMAAFMEKYAWAFEQGKAKGKLTAYFDKYGLAKGMKKSEEPMYLRWVGVMDYGYS